MRRALQGHRAADVDVGGLDLGLGEAEPGRAGRSRVVQLLGGNLQRLRQEIRAQVPFVEDELDVEGARERLFKLCDNRVGEALGAQGRDVDAGRRRERGVADGVGDDLGDLRLVVAERAQRLGDGAVDDLEIAAAGELLELHQREVGLDAGRVAIHHEADRAGRGDDGDLRVAVAVLSPSSSASLPRARARRRRAPPRRRRP